MCFSFIILIILSYNFRGFAMSVLHVFFHKDITSRLSIVNHKTKCKWCPCPSFKKQIKENKTKQKSNKYLVNSTLRKNRYDTHFLKSLLFCSEVRNFEMTISSTLFGDFYLHGLFYFHGNQNMIIIGILPLLVSV